MIPKTSTIGPLRFAIVFAAMFGFFPVSPVLAEQDTAKRKQFLERLVPLLYLEADEISSDPRISFEHQSWTEWLKKTGELPPDFDALPASAELPDPLVLRENGKETPITDRSQWLRQQTWMREQLQHWLYGSMPPPPGNVQGTVRSI